MHSQNMHLVGTPEAQESGNQNESSSVNNDLRQSEWMITQVIFTVKEGTDGNPSESMRIIKRN